MANTMSSVLEVLGMSLPYSSTPAMYPVTKYMKRLKPRDILTRQSFLNAITIVNVLGGSTNAIPHLLAIARAADVPLTIDDFQMISDKTIYLADLKPSGKYYMEDVHKIGGIPAIIKYVLKNTDLINGSQMTVTRKTLAENLVDPSGHLTILKGSLAPGTAVVKLTGKEGLRFEVIHNAGYSCRSLGCHELVQGSDKETFELRPNAEQDQ
ncbi:hypothetical protein EDB19DRAFT_1671959 [Suillus lakei]|nr:hypothetical protein EDB19DRAFT_1671959 [Suillus lakei]